MNLLLENLKRYIVDDEFKTNIESENIQMLCEAYEFNKSCINLFWNRYYEKHLPKIVICGINPGRFGAGQTGIPFLDNHSLSEMGFPVTSSDRERSADFFYSVVQAIGIEVFFKTFYVTNLSAIGYIKQKKNINYYDLPKNARQTVFDNFLTEMDHIKPTHIITLSVLVQNDIKSLIKEGTLSSGIDCSLRLPHPAWIMTYRQKSKQVWGEIYIKALEQFF